MADRVIVQAIESFGALNADGVPVQVARGALYYADDAIVAERPNLFAEPVVLDSTAYAPRVPRGFGPVEVATAAPGEVRAPVTPQGRAAAAGVKPVPVKGTAAKAPRPAGEV